MKILIGAACVAVIAASGFVIGRPLYDEHTEKVRAETARSDAREALFRFSHASPDEADKVTAICKYANSGDMDDAEMAKKVVNTCLIAGFPITY